MGVVLYEMLTGRLPFQQSTQLSTLYAIVNQESPGVSSVKPEVPKAVDDFVRRALAKKPEERWQTAEQAAAELRRVRAALGSRTTTMTVQLLPTVPTGTIQKKWGTGLLTAGVVALLAVAGYFGVRRVHPFGGALPDEKRIAVLPLAVAANDEALR